MGYSTARQAANTLLPLAANSLWSFTEKFSLKLENNNFHFPGNNHFHAKVEEIFGTANTQVIDTKKNKKKNLLLKNLLYSIQ